MWRKTLDIMKGYINFSLGNPYNFISVEAIWAFQEKRILTLFKYNCLLLIYFDIFTIKLELLFTITKIYITEKGYFL